MPLLGGAAAGVVVGDEAEADHVVEGREAGWEAAVEGVFEFFLVEEEAGADFVAHLDEVGEGEVGDGVGVGLAERLELVEGGGDLAAGAVEALGEGFAVFEGGVHALAVEGDDGVGGVTEEDGAAHDPGPAADGDE